MSNRAKFVVTLPEVHYQEYVVEAYNAEDAWNMVIDGDGEVIGDPQYQHILDGVAFEDWRVEEITSTVEPKKMAFCEIGATTIEVFLAVTETGDEKYHAEISLQDQTIRVPCPDATTVEQAMASALECTPK